MINAGLNGWHCRLFCLCDSMAQSAIVLGYSGEHRIYVGAAPSLRIEF